MRGGKKKKKFEREEKPSYKVFIFRKLSLLTGERDKRIKKKTIISKQITHDVEKKKSLKSFCLILFI